MNAAGTVWRQDEQEGENGRGNICSGEDACKKNVKDGGGGGGEDKCACDNDKGKMCVVERMNVRRISGRGLEGRNKMFVVRSVH